MIIGMINLKSSYISGSVLLISFAMVFVTFTYQYGSTNQISGQDKSGMLSETKNFKGNIVSVQNNDSGIQSWIISGRWKLTEAPVTSANTSTQNSGFAANLTMIKIDGTSSHKHRLTDFKLSDLYFKDGIYTVSGKVTLTTQGKDEPRFGDQPIIGVPVKIQIFNMHAITIDIDKNKVKNHFGNLPVYGIVT
jgi:hypothetical protein